MTLILSFCLNSQIFLSQSLLSTDKVIVVGDFNIHVDVENNIHPSIFYTSLIRRSGRGGAGAHPGGHRARGVGTPWTGGQSITEKQNNTIQLKHIVAEQDQA